MRIRQMEEAVRLILAMWTEKRTTFHGRYFHVEDAILEPKPVQKPRPPVMIAGGASSLHCARSLAWPMPATSAVIRKR
jgi:alkanesulfonate monooxygenase SsuD/methylene tetrahydromethanopterin reductase-like flavin-dependent oxidoreductase (luciferase family)